MKKLLFFASALAGLFLAGSCQQEEFAPVEESGIVTFEVQVPEVATKAYAADGTNVNDLVYAVYSTTATTQEEAVEGNLKFFYAVNEGTPVPFVNGKRIVSLELLNNQNYLILFWAQHDNAWVDEDGEAIDLFNVTYPTSMAANNQELEAFSGVSFITDVTGGLNKKVTLTRPFAQINLATKMPKAFTATLTQSSMTVAGAPESFNVATQVASDDVTESPLTFASATVPGGNFKPDYAYAGANYIFAGENNTVTVGYEISTSHGNVTKSVPSVPVAKNYRTNIIGNLLTSTADYEVEILPGFAGEIDRDPFTTYVTNDDELAAALSQDIKDIVIDLAQVETKALTPTTYNVNVSAHVPEYYLGTDKTRTITINANGNTINFVYNNSDWNYIRCVSEEAKWIINDAHLTNSKYNNGPWNRHDIRFYNAVELNNVTSDKAIALLNDGKLNDVQISDVHPESSEAYGLWITAEGQTVSLDGVTITPSEGKTTDRAIKIADQYVDSPAKVTLNVSNSKFVSQKKAAVLVTSPAGALINWGEGNDIKGVAADPINAVWVDEDYEEYASEVEVKGASKVVEGSLETVVADADNIDEVLAAAKDAENTIVVNLASGTYGTLPTLSSNVILNCAEGTVFEGGSDLNIKGATVIGATFLNENGSIVNSGTISGTYKNCVFEGKNALRYGYAGDTIIFEDCTFKETGDEWVFHFDGAASGVTNASIICRRCIFDGDRVAVGGGVKSLTMEDCEFINGWYFNSYCDSEFTGCDFNTQVRPLSGQHKYTNCTVKGDDLSFTNLTLYKDYNCTLTIDDVPYTWKGRILTNADGHAVVWRRDYLQYALDDATADMTILFHNDIYGDVTVTQKEGIKLVLNGNEKTYDGMITVDGKSATYTTAGLTIKGLTFNATSISADACINLGKEGDNNTRYTCNVTVENCTFDVPDAVGVKSYTGGDKNLTITGCTATAKAHSLVQAKGIDGILVKNCEVYSKNGLNFNNSDNVTVDNCTADVKGYAVRFGESSGGAGAAETYAIKNSTLKSACEDGDAVIILRGTADNSTLTIDKTTLEGTTQITNNAINAKVIIDGKEQKEASTQDALNSALTGNTEVTLSDGNYSLPGVSNGDVTISGSEDVVITINKPAYHGSDLTLNGVTVKGSGYSTGVQHVKTVTYNNVNVIGEMCLYGEKVVFNECTFELAAGQYIWTYGAAKVEFIGCTFNTAGKAILVYNEGAGASEVTVKGCTFNATEGAKAAAIANQNCAAVEVDNFQSSGTGAAHKVITSDNKYNNTYFSGEWRIKNFVAGNPVTVNGVEYTQIALDGKLMTIDASKNVTVGE